MLSVATQLKRHSLSFAASTWAPYWVLILAVFAAYGNIYSNVFLFDDQSLIGANAYLRSWDHIGDILTGVTGNGIGLRGGFYRPLQILLYFFVAQLNDTPTGFHLLNVSLHAINACLVYTLGTKLGFRRGGVFLAALVWALHPLHTEAVTYMSGTADPLFTIFCLWSLVILAPDFTPNKILKIIPLFLLGLASKETMAMFPLLVMACLFLKNPERLNARTYIRTWPLWILAILYVIWMCPPGVFSGPQRIVYFYSLPDYALNKAYSENISVRLYTFLATLPCYLRLLIWPGELHMERAFGIYTDPANKLVLEGLILFIVAGAAIVRSCRTRHGIEMSWGLLWFAFAHSPETGILIPINALFLEHWMYLPSVGLFLGLGETLALSLDKHPRAARTGAVLALVLAGAMFFKTREQNEIWRDPVSFYTNILRYERSIYAHNNLGNYYSDKGDTASAFEQYKQALEISDTNPLMRYNMALTYMKMPDWKNHIPDVIANLQRSLELDPGFSRSNQLLGDVYDFLGDKKQAEIYHSRAAANPAQAQ